MDELNEGERFLIGCWRSMGAAVVFWGLVSFGCLVALVLLGR